MKKYLLTLFSVIVSITLMGQEFTDESLRLTYKVIDTNNHCVEVKKQLNEFNNNQIKVVNIPPTVTFNSQEYTVIKIADEGFQQSNSLQTITIPNTVTQIGNNAFQGCGMLEEVNMPNTISEIGSAAFKECHKLHSISLPNNLTIIREDLFHSCHNLNEIILPEGIVSISARAFQNTHDVKIIFLGCGDANHEIIINSTAFQNCYNDDIEILCLEGVLNFKDQNNQPINFGNNTMFQVPCGMSTEYNTTYTNVTITEENCVSISRQSGPFCLPETWMGYDNWPARETYETACSTYADKEAWLRNNSYPTFVPRKPEHPFYIKEGHRVELNHSRHIYPFNSINKGVLVVNTQEGGQLIERDSLFFDEHYTLEVEYQINKVEGNVFITRNHHESTDITALLSDSHTTCGDYRYENGSIRDIETRYLLQINVSNDTYTVIDEDYYSMDNNNNILYYYGEYPNVITCDVDTLGTANSNVFWKETVDGVTYIKHNKTYNEETTTVTINMSGDVTLHGTDYSYGHVKMHENLGGEIEIVVPATQGRWNFVGAPFKDYDLYAVKVGAGNRDVTIVEFDYANKQWSNIFSTVEDEIKAGEGFLAWPYYDGGVVFSTKRDMTEISNTKQTKILESDFALNNDNVIVRKTIETTKGDNEGNWLALANPYPAKLCVNSFITENSTIDIETGTQENGETDIQGKGIYVHDATTNSFTFKAAGGNYDLGVGQGFFVNFSTDGEKEIAFTKNQLHDYNEPNHTPASKSSKKQFMTLSMLASGIESELLFAHNEKAQQGYDIFDANKLFAIEEITEPYFVTDGIALVKEEVKTLPYYAKMNVRSFEDKEVVFRINDIPEDLVVFLIDNGKDIRMNGKTEYTTTITAGENADRFQLLVKKASSIEDVKDDNIEISNSNRFVSVSSTQTDLIIEVYNALGQKIMTTNNYNFNLNESSAGAYIVKAYNKAVSKTQKIVIK